jgi:hypothetical protein
MLQARRKKTNSMRMTESELFHEFSSGPAWIPGAVSPSVKVAVTLCFKQ